LFCSSDGGALGAGSLLETGFAAALALGAGSLLETGFAAALALGATAGSGADMDGVTPSALLARCDTPATSPPIDAGLGLFRASETVERRHANNASTATIAAPALTTARRRIFCD
jgi:hypothetical protein